MNRFSADQMQRYRRHLTLSEVGEEGQARLLDSKVAIVGAGGLGCPAALYLTAAGVGSITLVDDDRVDASNLQRQVLYDTRDVGSFKVEKAAERLGALNPDVRVNGIHERLEAKNAEEILAGHDVVLDGTDTFPARYLMNDICVWLGLPLVSGSIQRFEGHVSVFDSRRGPCYRCLFPEPPPPELAPNCAEAGVLGVLPGVVGTMQATEVLKLLLGMGESLAGRLLVYESLGMEFRTFTVHKDPGCAVCGENPTIREPIDYEAFCASTSAESEVQVPELAPKELDDKLRSEAKLLLLDVREPDEWEIVHLDQARLIPLGEIEGRLAEIDDWREREVIVYCHHGGRSRAACEILISSGFRDVTNLRGGIEGWAREVDPSTPRY
jgi:adenylyltransferase/sulfurtransferase